METYKDEGLLPHPGKTFYEEQIAEIWGSRLDGDKGLVQANPKPVLPIVSIIWQVILMKTTCICLLEIPVGGITLAQCGLPAAP